MQMNKIELQNKGLIARNLTRNSFLNVQDFAKLSYEQNSFSETKLLFDAVISLSD